MIYALRQLREKHTIEPGEIESVVVDTFYDAWILPKHKPKTTEEAQFSVVWPLACELYFGKYNFKTVSLSVNRLRTETAGVFVVNTINLKN